MRTAARVVATATAGLAVTGAAVSLPATAQVPPPPVTGETAPPVALTANGNAFAGNLSFAPANADAKVGQTLRWRNTDGIAPHTVTEDHDLFDLVGNDANGTPVSEAGFGPGTTVELTAFAGTTSYFCRVHPGDMNGVIKVPVATLLGPGYKAPKTPAKTKAGKASRALRKKNFQRRLTLTWAAVPPPDGRGYDVQVRRGSGPWKPLLTRTVDTTITIASGKRGTTARVRARMRLESDETKSTGWSPEVTIRP